MTTKIKKQFVAFVESFNTKFPSEVMAIKLATDIFFENDESDPNIPAGASIDDLKKLKETINKNVDTKIQAKELTDKSNTELATLEKEITDNTKRMDANA